MENFSLWACVSSDVPGVRSARNEGFSDNISAEPENSPLFCLSPPWKNVPWNMLNCIIVLAR